MPLASIRAFPIADFECIIGDLFNYTNDWLFKGGGGGRSQLDKKTATNVSTRSPSKNRSTRSIGFSLSIGAIYLPV